MKKSSIPTLLNFLSKRRKNAVKETKNPPDFSSTDLPKPRANQIRSFSLFLWPGVLGVPLSHFLESFIWVTPGGIENTIFCVTFDRRRGRRLRRRRFERLPFDGGEFWFLLFSRHIKREIKFYYASN